MSRTHRFTRYVALGDSTTEGLEDPYPDGRGYRGWTDRLAGTLDELEPGLLYANLAVRGKRTHEIREEQLEPALALEPDLASILAGINDVLRRHCDVDVVAGHLDAIVGALAGAGATVLTFTFPDPVPINPLTRPARAKLFALNDAVRELSARHGALVVDLQRHPVASDPRLWHSDRLHANPAGHARITAAAAYTLGLPGADPQWDTPLPPADPAAWPRWAADYAIWAGRDFAPWLVRRLRGRSSGDGRVAKRPDLLPVPGEDTT